MKLLEGRKGTVVRLEDAPVLQQILRERHHILFEDPQNDPRVRERMRALAREDGIQTVLTWPLLYAGKLIGVLDLISTQRHLFLPEDISLFSTLADQTATAVRNAQLFSETRQRLDEISLLFDLSAALRAELNMDGMLPLILEKAMVGLDADGAAVIVCDTNTNVLQVRMARGAFEGEIGQSHPLEDMPADCAMRTSGICLGQDDCPFLPDSGRPFNIACVPFRVGEQTLGGLHIGTRRENNYNERELRLLAGIADLAANALRRVALFEEVRLYKDAFASTTDGITITDLQTRIMDVNPAFEQLTGISRQEALGQKPSIVKSRHSTPEFYRKMWEQILSQGSWEGEVINQRKNDEEWNSHLTISTVRDERGRPVAYVGINRDITARKQAEAQIQRQLQQITTLRNIDMVITASLDLRLTLNVLLDQVTSQLDIHAADILLLHPHSRMLEYTAGRGFRTTALQYTRLRLGEGLAGQAALERRTISIPDFSSRVADFPQATVRNLQTENFVAYYGVPLVAKGQVKGVLEIFHRAPIAPDPQWLEFLEALAAQASIAIDNAALFTDLQRSNVELALAYDATIEGWSHALDLRDRETEGHTQRVTEMTERLARAFGLDEAEMVHVRRGALLHDMGKMGVPDNILLKAGPLTEEEWAIMHQHPQHAYDMLHQIAYLRPALDIPYCHHERWDGSGYPQGLKGEQIPLVARIFAIVDVWDALTSDRPYRKAWSQEQAREHIRSLAGVHFDPQVVKMFMEMIEVDGEEG
jgi:PAS domain S-box-containing protein